MATPSALWPNFHSPRSIPSIIHHLLPPTRSLRQQASARLIAHRPAATPFTTHLPPLQPQTRAFSRRPFMSSSARPEQHPQSISGEDWEKLSPEAKIQWLGEDKWGWVIYRTSYARVFDGPWNNFKRRIQQEMRESIAKSDAPGIAEKMDFVFVEDPALEGASPEELRRRFQAWARNTATFDLDNAQFFTRGSRYEFFVKVDGEGLWNCYVSLIQAWPFNLGEDWMKVRASAVAPGLYVELDNPEAWYAYYKPPEMGVSDP